MASKFDPTPTNPQAYLDQQCAAGEITDGEKTLLYQYIQYRNTIKPTARSTRKKQAYVGVGICRDLHAAHATLDTCTVRDLLSVAGRASDRPQNSRQTIISQLKALAKYISRFHHPIPDLDLLGDVRGGSAAKNRKTILSESEWEQALNSPMSSRDRAMIAMLYDGYHRPGEILTLRWSDLRINDHGRVEYQVQFKTEKRRTIVQKGTTTALVEIWRQEAGRAYGDPSPIFPDRAGRPYRTTTVLRDLFADLRKKTGIRKLVPSMLRNTAITHDVEAGLPTSYICLRAWGEAYNEMINVYAQPDSGRMQDELHDQKGLDSVKTARNVSRQMKNVIICPGCQTANPPNAIMCYACATPLTPDFMRRINDLKKEVGLDVVLESVSDLNSDGVTPSPRAD